jgi:hypothetical protein
MDMAKTSVTKSAAPKGERTARDFPERGTRRSNVVQRDATTSDPAGGNARVEAVMAAAERSGLLSGKSGRIGGRVSPALVEQAKRQTGIATDTDLIEFALATVALEDNFAEAFKESRGKVEPELELGY